MIRKEESYLVMMVPTRELTLSELKDYGKMPNVDVELDAATGEATIVKRQY